MAFAVGIILFGLGIAISIALHEAGHMYAARWTGMRVRRYFIGFGHLVIHDQTQRKARPLNMG